MAGVEKLMKALHAAADKADPLRTFGGELTGMQRARLDSVPEKRDEHRLSESLYAVGHKRSKRCPEDIFTTKQSITLMPELSRILIELV